MSAPSLWRSDHRMRFVDQVSADLSLHPSACRLAIALSRFVNSRTLLCWPTQETLAELVGLKKRHVQNILDALAGAGHLQVISVVDKRQRDRRRNGYRIILKDAVSERILSSQRGKDEENQSSNDANALSEQCAENEPDIPDRRTPVHLNKRTPVHLNRRTGVRNNKEEDNLLESNSARALSRRAQRDGAGPLHRARAFERLDELSKPPDYSHSPATLSAEARTKMGLPQEVACGPPKGDPKNLDHGGSLSRSPHALGRQCENPLEELIFMPKLFVFRG